MRRWELVSGGSAKFWEIGRDGSAVTVRFGRLETAGQTQTKELASVEAAEAHVAKLVAEKEKKGYRAVSSAEPTQADAPVVDETTWVMPKAWLRDVVRQRGFDPAPMFELDQELAAKARQRPVRQVATLDRVMASPDSHADLVQAARDHLAGRPDPLGAAAIAVMTERDVASVHHWIADHDLAFAVEAMIHSIGIYSGSKWLPGQGVRSKPHVYRYGDVDVSNGSLDAQLLTVVRYAMAVADDADREAAEAVLERMSHPVLVLVRAYLATWRTDWFDEACRQPGSMTRWWLIPCSAGTYDEFAHARTTLTNGAYILRTAVYVLGPAVAPLLAKELDRPHQLADSRKQVLKVLAALPTDEAFTILLDRLDTKYVRPALLSAMTAFPARAARLLTERVDGNGELRQLLSVHLTTHPHLEVPDGFIATDSVTVPEAPAEALPSLLVSPPWLDRRPPVKPVVVPDVPMPAPSAVWEPGEQEAWLRGAYWADHHDWRKLLNEYVKTRSRLSANPLFLMAPEDEVRHLLADWRPDYGWSSESSGRRIAARFGLDALPPLLHIAESNASAAEILLPFASPEVAALMADWLVRLKQARRVAVDWLARHRETAARFLLPAALGSPGAERRNAEAAIRWLQTKGVDVVAAAPTAEAARGIETVLSVDPVDVLPAKLPAIGEWADTRLLPQVLLRDRKHALSPEAAKHLLMTAALSKQGDVYAGLPIARAALDRDSLAEFAWAVFQRWQEVGAPPKEGWGLAALGWFGDDSTVRALSPLIRTWPGESQHAKAVIGLDVLAGIGTEVALSHLNGIAEKVKFKGLKARAQEKVAQIAAELGLSRDQLADRLVPRLGLDDEASLVIDYGPRQFTVGFDEQLKPYVLDPDGKRRKDLPKPGAKDDQDRAPLEHKRYTALKKDVRTVAADQIHRLERAMVDQRTWTAEEFHTVLAAHPLLWHIVRRLVWVTGEGLSFRLAEDRTLADSGDDEFTLADNATVRVAHPVDLQATLEAWGEVFADYEILQPFPQLGRPLHVPAPGEDFLTTLKNYTEVPYAVGRILSLTKKGWVRGEPQDAGIECWISRPLPRGGALVASLDPGIAVGAVDFFPEIEFSSLGYSANGDGYWSARKAAPAGAEIDPITISEVLSELESLRP